MINSTQAIQAADQFATLAQFMPVSQLKVIRDSLRGAEGEYFFEKVMELSELFKTMPKTYEQDGKGDDAIIYLHYFRGGMDWFITEKDMEAEQIQAFGLADLGYGGELGYISIVELIQNDVELDLHWSPKTLREVKESRK